jgi:1-acyl-sn-glycerol-3-phosphate acyltransferase
MLLSIIKLVLRPLFRVFFSVEYHGVANVPPRGAVIIAGNHPSYLDPVLVLLPVERPIRFMGWDLLFKIPLLGQIFHALGAFPVDIRKGKGEAAFQQALRILQQDEALGIFPEGQRSEQGLMGELRTGVARLAVESGAPIVPVTIGGAIRAWPKWKLLPRPAKLIVRFHEPLQLTAAERLARGQDKEFHQEVMQRVAAHINRSLRPALHEASQIERWYAQPPSNIRTYEWAPLLAACIAMLVALQRNTFAAFAGHIWLPVAVYYLYLVADLTVVKPSRLAKWVRNSMPVWLILLWHHPLTMATGLPAGERNTWLTVAALAAFFPFFYEDYFSLQKFVRGLVVSYYFSLAMSLAWPHPLGTLTAVLSFITIFCWHFRVLYYHWTVAGMLGVLAASCYFSQAPFWTLLPFIALAFGVLAYLQTFITIAYDIRRAGNVAEE